MRILHLTTEFPPVIYGGLGTAVGGWVTAYAHAGMTMGVLLVEGELVVDDPAGGSRYGGVRAPVGGRHASREAEGGERAVVDRRDLAARIPNASSSSCPAPTTIRGPAT